MKKEEILEILEKRFKENMDKHPNCTRKNILKKIENDEEKINTLIWMEETGGKPDVIAVTGRKFLMYVDTSEESPIGRRSLCYDKEAREKRKNNKPESSAMEMAKEHGLRILNKSEYRNMQAVMQFDKKTSSWIKTPREVRNLGGAMFSENRYNRVFTYHNSAGSYYASRGFRGYFLI